ncbi:MAG: SMI1/KNR4 family protein [Pseudomonadota bacterium]
MTLGHIKAVLMGAGVAFSPGLTPSEFSAAEARYGFKFPPDLRRFLAFAVPTGEKFPDWRNVDSLFLLEAFSRPLEGLWFDVKQNSLWLPEWGPKPVDDATAYRRLSELVQAAPTLIPVQGHRYLPCRPCEAGNPVLSVHQSDIICYGLNLEDYFQNEYSYHFGRQGYELSGEPKPIEFWASFIG